MESAQVLSTSKAFCGYRGSLFTMTTLDPTVRSHGWDLELCSELAFIPLQTYVTDPGVGWWWGEVVKADSKDS